MRVESTVRVMTVVPFCQSNLSRGHDAVNQNVTQRRTASFASFGQHWVGSSVIGGRFGRGVVPFGGCGRALERRLPADAPATLSTERLQSARLSARPHESFGACATELVSRLDAAFTGHVGTDGATDAALRSAGNG